jgi:hypothetical protein
MAPRPSPPKPPHPSRGAIRLRFVQRVDDEPTTTSFVSVVRLPHLVMKCDKRSEKSNVNNANFFALVRPREVE